MTPPNIFKHLCIFLAALVIGAYVAVLLADTFEPGSALARSCVVLFQWSTSTLIGYAVGVVGLMLAWGAWQVFVGRELIYLDDRRQVVVRREANQADDFVALDVQLPDPRRSNLAWLDDVIADVLDRE